MPELPEVETMCRGLKPIVGGTIRSVHWPPCQRKPIFLQPGASIISRRLTGKQVSAVQRLGKRIVIRLQSGERLVIEPRMTGLVLLGPPPTEEHVRMEIDLRRGRARPTLRFWDRRGLGRVMLMDEGGFQTWRRRATIGPDALHVTARQLRRRLGKSDRAIKVALLDQHVLAGVGNLYASELLHVAKIYPGRTCRDLSVAEWNRLCRAMRRVLRDAIRFEGSTLSDGTYRNALNQPGSYQNCHRVYDREGQICPTCNRTVIRRMLQSQRSTYYCPKCQVPRVGRRAAVK